MATIEETRITAFSSWRIFRNSKQRKNSDDFIKQHNLPKIASRWPLISGDIEFYESKNSRFAKMLFYPLGQELPPNDDYDSPDGGGKKWHIIHAHISFFFTVVTMLSMGVKVNFGYNPADKSAWIDTATQSPVKLK